MTHSILTKITQLICVTGCSILFAGCSLLSPINAKEPNKYSISEVPLDIPIRRQHHSIILVLPPETQAAFNTTQMAYSIWPYQIAYYANNTWTETPSQMLQPLIVQTLESSHYYKAVINGTFAGHYDYALYTQILDLSANFTANPANLDLTVRAQLIKMDSNEVVATKVFYIMQPLVQKKPYSSVVAANLATAEMLRRLTSFCIRHSH